MYKILNDGQVMYYEKGDNYEIEHVYGNELKPQVISKTDDYTEYGWARFNVDLGRYQIDTSVKDDMIIEGKIYSIPEGHTFIKVPNTSKNTLELLGQQLAEEKIKNIQNTAIINQLGQELTELKLQLMKGSDE